MRLSGVEHREKHPFGGSRQPAQATATCPRYAVHDGRCDGTDGNFADALGAKRPIRLRIFNEKSMNFGRHVECCRYFVVHEAGVGDLSSVPNDFLAKREAQPLGKTALYLSF